MSDEHARQSYKPGDCVAEVLGEITLRDGRSFNGIILTFPEGPPRLPISAVWDRTPLTLTLRAE
jgi:hypothetical protein